MTDSNFQNGGHATCCQASSSSNYSEQASSYTPRFDVQETDNELILYGDLPGVAPEDLEVRFENGELSIHGKVSRESARGRLLRDEYGVGDFERTFSVSETIDADNISASLNSGVLTLHLPKSEAVKPRKIKIES